MRQRCADLLARMNEDDQATIAERIDSAEALVPVTTPDARNVAARRVVRDYLDELRGLREAFLRQVDEPPQRVSKEIDDFGEKIGGARKDTAQPSGKSVKAAIETSNETPAWRKRFIPMQVMDTGEIDRPHAGEWFIFDKRTNDPVKDGYRVRYFATEAEAEAAIPLAAVALKHRVVGVNGGEAFEIWRDVTDRKRVKVVDRRFATREDALRYMIENAAAIIETKTSFGEEVLARPEQVMRQGQARRDRPATAEMFMETFGFRGVEFGLWNNQAERQEVMNHAFDALLDLADIIDVPPKALSLNGDLALAFGARGQGVHGARAHYETDYGVINLTKLEGAGALAHEWFHALDHYFRRQDMPALDKKAPNERGDPVYPTGTGGKPLATHGFAISGGQIRPEVKEAITRLVRGMFTKAEKYVEDTENAAKFVGKQRDALRESLDRARDYMAREITYKKRNNKPATPEQLAAFDELADRLVEGVDLKTFWKPGDKGGPFSGRTTNAIVEEMSLIFKAVRGSTGFMADRSGLFDGVVGQVQHYAQRVKMLEDAKAGTEKEKRVPTSFAMDAKRIDQGRATDYWTTEHEMAARAFSAYVEDKIAEKGGASYFLSYGSDNNLMAYRLLGIRPFPEGAERQALNALFDELFAAIETKETERGIAMYARGSLSPVVASLEAIAETPGAFKYPESTETAWPDVIRDMAGPRDWRATPGDGLGDELTTGSSRLLLYRGGDRSEEGLLLGSTAFLEINRADTLTPYATIGGRLDTEGALAYQIAMTWAHNNGKRLVPDPSGLTAKNRLRRSEAMISSMLRHGTSVHLEPHASQFIGLLGQEDFEGSRDLMSRVEPGTAVGRKLERLKEALWRDEALAETPEEARRIYEANLHNLALASSLLTHRLYPDAYLLEVTKDGQIRDTITDEPVSEMGSVESAGLGVGRTTLARAVAVRSALQGVDTYDVAALRLRRDGFLQPGGGELLAERRQGGPLSDAGAARLVAEQGRLLYGRGAQDKDAVPIGEIAAGTAKPLRREGLSVSGVYRLLYAGMGQDGVDALVDAGHLRVVARIADLPERLRRVIEESGNPAVDAVYDGSRTAYIIASNIDPDRVVPVVFHEIGEHFGLERLLGPEDYRKVLDKVRALHANGDRVVTGAWRYVLDNYRTAGGELELAEGSDDFVKEVIARVGEGAPAMSQDWWRELLQMVRNALRRMGFTVRFTADDLTTLVRASLASVVRDARQARYVPSTADERVRSVAFHRAGDQDGTAAEKMRGLVRAATKDGDESRTVTLGDVSLEEAVEAQEAAGLAIEGYSHTADVYAVRHAMKEHGGDEEVARGQVPITEDDFAAVPGILASPEARVYGAKNRRGQDLIASVGRTADGGLLVIQEARTGRKSLALASLRKYPAAKDVPAISRTVLLNARNDGGDMKIIEQPAPGFNDRTVGERPAGLSMPRRLADEPRAPMMSRHKPTGDPVLDEARRKAGLVRDERNFAERASDYLGRGWSAIRQDLADFRHALAQGAVDRFHAIKLLEQTLGGVPAEQSAYVAARLSTGTSSVMRGMLIYGAPELRDGIIQRKEGSKGLLDVLAPVREDFDDWIGWMVGVRATRLMKEKRERNLTEQEIEALVKLGEGKTDRFIAVAREFAAYKRAVLDLGEAAGLINPETRPVWDQADWIPFYRVKDGDSAAGPRARRGLAGQTSGIRTLKGGEQAINDPLENILLNFTHLVDASMKNVAMQRAAELAGAAGILERAPYEWEREIVAASDIRKRLQEHGVSDQIIDFMPPDVFKGLAAMWAVKPPAEKDVVRVMVGGKPAYYRVLDPLLLRALTAVDAPDLAWTAPMRAFKRVLTRAVTATPDFMARNFIRDALSAWAISEDNFRVGIDSVRGAVKSLREQGGMLDMMFAGGSFMGGYVNGNDPTATAEATRKALRERGWNAASVDKFMATIVDTPLRWWEKWEELGSAIENANREAAYEAAIRKGKTKAQAVFSAKDQMDYSMRGDWIAFQVLGDVVPFFNARLQGLYKLGRAAADHPGRLAFCGGIIMLATLALLAANDGDDRYEELEEWDRDTYWHFWIGGQHLRIPKPFEIGVIFATIPERMARMIAGRDEAGLTMKRLWWNLSESLNLVQWPQIVAPAAEVWANRDTFTGRPIEGKGDEGKLPEARASATTSDTMKAIARLAPDAVNATGMSPKRLEHLWRGYLGEIGAYALGLSDIAVRAVTGAPARPAMRADDVPLVKSFVREDPPRATRWKTELYDMDREVDEIYRSVMAYRRDGDGARAKALIEKEGRKLAARPGLSAATDRLADIRRERDRVVRDPEMTREDKRLRLDELQSMENDLAERAARSLRPAFVD